MQDLFRHKLENAELIPDPSVGVKLMRKLAMREFIHFNPLRFNVYYLGGIIIATITGIAILTSHNDKKEKSLPEIYRNSSPPGNNIVVPERSNQATAVTKRTVKSGNKHQHVISRKGEGSRGPDLTVILPGPDSLHKTVVPPRTIKESLRDKSLFNRTLNKKPKLQERFTQGKSISISSISEGCAPLRVQFKNWLSAYDYCQWNFGDGGSSRERDPEWIYDEEGEYKVDLEVYGPVGLIATFSAVISVYPKPTARFEIQPEKAIIPDDQIRFQNYSADAVSYLWQFGDGTTSEQFEPLHRYQKFGRYNVSLKVTSEKGCSDSLIVYNAFSGSAYYIVFPNAFIANAGGPSGGAYSMRSDESDQVFHPDYSGVSEYHLKIFSKLGVVLFESNDINTGWDGYYKGQLCNPGVYVWKVRGNFSNGETFTKMGDLTLLKK